MSMGTALSGSPIKSMAEFRKHVISKKQAESRGHAEPDDTINAGSTGGPVKFESISIANSTGSKLEMTHNPN